LGGAKHDLLSLLCAFVMSFIFLLLFLQSCFVCRFVFAECLLLIGFFFFFLLRWWQTDMVKKRRHTCQEVEAEERRYEAKVVFFCFI